jgi:hypothetical protein
LTSAVEIHEVEHWCAQGHQGDGYSLRAVSR